MASKPQLLTGARGILQKSNPTTGILETVAFVTDVNINRRVGNRVSYVLGRMNGAANDNLSYDVDVSIGRVLPMNSVDGTKQNWTSPTPSGQSGAVAAPTTLLSGLEPTIASMTTADDFTLAVYDGVTKQYVASVRGCRYAGGNTGLNAGDVGSERLQYVGILDSGYGGTENVATDGYGLGA